MNGFIDLFTMNWHVLRSHNAEPHFITTDLHDRDDDVIVNDNRLVLLPRQHQHDERSFRECWSIGSGDTNTTPVCDTAVRATPSELPSIPRRRLSLVSATPTLVNHREETIRRFGTI
jgi:hypothetical protein